MRSLATLFFTLIAFTSVTLLAQNTWQPVSVPDGDHVPDELIIRFPANDPLYVGNPTAIKDDILSDHGLLASVTQIDQAGQYYLIRFKKTAESSGPIDSYCVKDSKYPLPCSLCGVVSNPGGGGPMGRGDGLWLNYEGTSGLETTYTQIEGYSASEIFGEQGFDPLAGEPTISSLTDDSEIEDCYEGYTLPSSGVAQQTQLKVAILDSGISPQNYLNFFNYLQANEPQSIIEFQPVDPEVLQINFSNSLTDENGHGTAIAFLLAHDFVNQLMADKIKLHSYKILDGTGRGTLASVLWSLDQAIINDMDIINLSFGFREGNCVEGALTAVGSVFDGFFSRAQEENILIFTSAGNDGEDLVENPQWPADNRFANVLTVGADHCLPGNKWEMSNYSSTLVDLMAPGYNIALPYIGTSIPGNYILDSGTSFATPLAASVAASYYAVGGYDVITCALANDLPFPEGEANPNSLFGSIFDFDATHCPIIIPDSEENPPVGNSGQRQFSGSNYAYPNPFNGQISIPISVEVNGSPARARILDSNGRAVIERTLTTTTLTLNTAKLFPGIYYLEVIDASGSNIQRIIKH